MEGFTLLRKLKELVNESTADSFMNDRTSYDNLYDAVLDFNIKTHYITQSATIAVVAGTSTYDMPPDYIDLALFDSYNRKYIKWTSTASVNDFVYPMDYTNIVLENSTATASVPSGFAIKSADQPTNISGTASSTNAAVNGESSLVSATDLSSAYPGDFIHNTTAGTDGVVTAKTSTYQLETAMFHDGNSGGGWTATNAFILIPQTRYQLVITPIPSESGTITIVYIKRPDPVYSLMRAYNLPFTFTLPIVQFAAFLYKYKNSEPNYGDAFYKFYDAFSRKIAAETRRSTGERQGMRVNFSKMNSRSKSIGNWSR